MFCVKNTKIYYLRAPCTSTREVAEGRGLQCKNEILKAFKLRRIGWKCSLERSCADLREDCTMLGPYCDECSGRSESRGDLCDESAPSGIDEA